MGRITIDGDSRAFSLQTDADPDLWDAAAGRMTGKSRLSLAVNREIEKYREKIDGFYHQTLYSQGYITAETVKNSLEGRGQRETGLMKLYREHNEEFSLRVGVDKTKATYIKYRRSYSRLADFLHDIYSQGNRLRIRQTEVER
jgi:DNA-binding transcriptional regulator WhiA